MTYLEPTYLPTTVAFSLDQGNTTCPIGKMLLWSKPEVESNKAAYSTILAAMMAGKKIRYYFNNGDTNCMGVALHISPN